MAGPAHTRASTDSPWGASLLESLRERPEVQVAAAYVGGAWLCYDVADLMVFAFDLPDVVLRVILGLLALGVVSGRTAMLATAASTLVFLVLFLFLWHSWAAAHERQVTDPRITLAVFPFGDAGGGELRAGVADLLAVTIDGTPGLRVVDPSTAWQSLAGSQEEDPPDLGPAQARGLGRDLGRLSRLDARGTYGAYELMTAPVAEVDRLLSAWAGRDVAVVTTVLRDLRTARPDLADRYLTELAADTMPTYHRRLGRGGRTQLR